MKVNCFLTVNSRGSVKVTKNKPGLNFDEIAISVNLEVPDAFFHKPQIQATISLPESAATKQSIDAEVLENLEKSIIQNTGIRVQFSALPEEESNNTKSEA